MQAFKFSIIMQDFLLKMESIDSKANHRKNLDSLLLTYLSSSDANNQKQRCEMLVLMDCLNQLFM